MHKQESLRLTFSMGIYCFVLAAVTLALYFLYLWLVPSPESRAMRNTVLPMPEKPAVIVDAGHGGRDGGATGVTGLVEKELNLEIAMRMYDILRASGVTACMTRSVDSLVCDENDPALRGRLKQTDLKNRAALAEANPDALFVSIHMNNFPVEKYSGLQVYYSKHAENSRVLAEQMQANAQRFLQPENTRKIKPAGSNIFLLDRIRSTAVLVECGFLSNRAESAKLSEDIYQKQLALVLTASVLQNLQTQP